MKTIMGWHFLNSDKKLGYSDGRKVRKGVKMTYRGDGLNLCKSGMHGSKRIIDALKYAPGPVIAWCEFGGKILHGKDKFCAEWRRVIWWKDITILLHNFACDEAERCLNNIEKEGYLIDPRSRAAIVAKREWLDGNITNNELTAAREAASAAASAAARAAAREAAWAAAWAAASEAAEAAASEAAREAARVTARVIAWEAARRTAREIARARQNKRLTKLVKGLMDRS